MRFWKTRKLEGKPVVGIAVAAYLNDDGPEYRQHHAFRALCCSLLAQTYPCQVHVWHDGPYETSQKPKPSGVEWHETEERKQQFGHPHRQAAVEALLATGCDWIGLTNQDNYYVPVYVEWMVSEAQRQKAPFVYCDFVRSHKQWVVHNSRPKKGQLDLGAFLVHKSLVTQVKFDRFAFDGDGDYINRLVQAARNKTAKVSTPLFIHN